MLHGAAPSGRASLHAPSGGGNPLMQGMEAVIPPRANRTETIHYDPEKYQLREKVERWFNKLKPFRRIATRYDKLSRTFLAFVHLAATWIMVRSFINTA